MPNSVAMLSVSDPIPLVTGTMPTVATDKDSEELPLPSAVAGDVVAISMTRLHTSMYCLLFLGQQ